MPHCLELCYMNTPGWKLSRKKKNGNGDLVIQPRESATGMEELCLWMMTAALRSIREAFLVDI